MIVTYLMDQYHTFLISNRIEEWNQAFQKDGSVARADEKFLEFRALKGSEWDRGARLKE